MLLEDFIFSVVIQVICSIPAIYIKQLRKALLLLLGIWIVYGSIGEFNFYLGDTEYSYQLDDFVYFLYALFVGFSLILIPYEILILIIFGIIKLFMLSTIRNKAKAVRPEQ